jgi:succinate-semialdehyde dehydrogenase/glutarate-semialdehyde dehydrogenase
MTAATAPYAADLALFIDGAWQSGEGRDAMPVLNPANAQAMADLPKATTADLAAALAAAERAFPVWRATDVETRAAVLRKTAQLLRERSEDIAVLMTMEQGKPIAESRSEVMGSAQLFEWCAEEARRMYGRTLVRPSGMRSMVLQQPIGPVALFTPWNFPLYLMAKKVAAALAVGCSVIAKPAEETPGCTTALMRCLADAGLPAGVAQLVFGDPAMISSTLIASPVIRKISFTGSTAVGKHLMRLCADNVTQSTMELGGHAPVLIFADCDLEKTLDLVVPQKFRNAGQVCVSPTRFLVEAPIHDAFVRGFAERTAGVTIGNGLDATSKMGPLANARRPDAVATLVDDAVAKGAALITGGGRENGPGNFFRPTLLAGVPDSADIMRVEPFGPVAATRPFETFDEAIHIANSTPFGLAAFAFTENGRRANLLGDALEAGMIGINGFGISVADAPFGGVKQSGFGSEGGQEGLASYCVTKAVHQV